MSIIGFLIFIYIIYKYKWNLYGIIVAVFLSLLIFPHTTNNFQSDPLFEHSLIDKTDRHDLFYHSTIASNYKNYNFCTTALHGTPEFKYWDLTNILASKLSVLLDIRCIDIYNYILPIFLWIVLLKCFLDLALFLKDKIHPDYELNIELFFIISPIITAILCFQAYIGPIQNFLRWEAPKVLAVPLGAILFSYFILVNSELFNLKKIIVRDILIMLFSSLLIYLIISTKLYLLYYLLITSFVFFIYFKNTRTRVVNISVILIAVIIYFHQTSQLWNIHSFFEISPLHLFLKVMPISQVPYIFLIYGLPCIALIYFASGNIRLFNFHEIIKSKVFITPLIFSLFYFFSISICLIFGGSQSWNLFYFTDTYLLFLIFPITFYFTRYISKLKITKIRLSYSVFIILFIIVSLSSIFSSFKSIHQSFTKKDSILTANYQSKKLVRTLKRLSSIQNDGSVLYIPKNCKRVWNSIKFEYDYLKPLFYTALSETPLLYGLPDGFNNTDSLNMGFGFHSYRDSNYTKPLNYEEVKFNAKSFGYKNLITLTDDFNFNIEPLL